MTETDSAPIQDTSPEDENQEFTFSEREEAILRGEDPNQVGRDDDKTPAENPADESSEAKDTAGDDAVGKDESSPDEEARSWHEDEDLRAVAQSYGMSAEELKRFGTVDAFRHAAQMIDRQFFTNGQQAQQKPVPPSPSQPAPAVSQPSQQQQPKPVELDPQKYRDAGYDDETVALVEFAKATKDELESLKPAMQEMAWLNQQIATIQERQRLHQTNVMFHDIVDSFEEDLFGRVVDGSGKEKDLDQQHDTNRRKLYEAAETILAGIHQRSKSLGRQPELPPLNVLLTRAKNLAFADELHQRQRREFQDRVSSQSRRRRPAGTRGRYNGSAAGGRPAKDGHDPVQAVLNDPEIQRFFEE